MAEKRYLLDQALDHELDALIETLRHNLLVIGYPIDEVSTAADKDTDQSSTASLFTKPLHSYKNLQKDQICYVDMLGSTYLMPCLA